MLAKCDIKSAFWPFKTHPEDFDILGVAVYYHKALPMEWWGIGLSALAHFGMVIGCFSPAAAAMSPTVLLIVYLLL